MDILSLISFLWIFVGFFFCFVGLFLRNIGDNKNGAKFILMGIFLPFALPMVVFVFIINLFLTLMSEAFPPNGD